MSKVKEFCTKMFSTFNTLFKRYPVSVILIIITTLFVTIFLDSSIMDDKLFVKTLMFLVTTIVGTFFSETVFKNKTSLVTSSLLAGVIAFAFVKFFDTITNDIWLETIGNIYFGYILILFTLSIYKILENSKLKFSEYVFTVFSSIFKNSIVYSILAIGITLISLAFMELIFEDSDFDTLIRINILIFGLYYVLAFVNSISKQEKDEESKFINGIVKYVLLPLVTIAFLIIYMYIVKILVLQKIPSNIIFPMLMSLFIAAFPIWNMAENFTQNKLVVKTARILPYAFMPFILLEIYSIAIRITQYGYTPARYMGVLFLILQIAALILTVVKDRKYISKIFIFITVLTLIATTVATPFQVSRRSQINIIEKNMPEGVLFENLTDEAKEKVRGAYCYLRWEPDIYMPDNVIGQEEIINEYDASYEIDKNRREYIYLWHEEALDITGFSKLMEANVYSSNDDGNLRLELSYGYKREEKRDITRHDVIDYVKEIISNYEEGYETLNNNIIVIDENTVFCIKNIDISYYYKSKEISYLSMEGYLLER